jgi:hypothetical protein
MEWFSRLRQMSQQRQPSRLQLPMSSLSQSSPQPNSPASSQPLTMKTIALPEKARGIAFGMTGSGKSVLTQHLMYDWMRRYPATGRVLILDSKPNYRAMWRLNGTSARGEYKRMEKEPAVPDSVLLRLQRHGELRQVWAQGHHVAIAQIWDIGDIGALRAVMKDFYTTSDAKYHQLALIDETADFYSSSAAYSAGDPILQVIRSGRKRHVACLACSQRPASLPGSLLSEATNVYVFDLPKKADRQKLEEANLPADMSLPTNEHEFYYYSRQGRASGTYKLNIEGAAA